MRVSLERFMGLEELEGLEVLEGLEGLEARGGAGGVFTGQSSCSYHFMSILISKIVTSF